MASITYDEIYSQFLSRASAYDLILGYITEDSQKDFMRNWLHSAMANPQIRGKFNSLSLDDENQIMTYEPKNDEIDADYVLEICAQGILVAWTSNKLYNIKTMEQMISDGDKKWYAQSTHSAEIRNIRDSAKIELGDLLARHGAYWNRYLSGESASSSLRRGGT